MSGVAQHIDALIGGLLAVPDFRKNAGEAVWSYLALLKAANHRGVVCRRSDQITDMLQTDEATLLADLARLVDLGLARVLNPAPYLVVQLTLWPGKDPSADARTPVEAGPPPAAPLEVPVSSSAAAAASASQPEVGGLGEGGELLQRVLDVLGSEADATEMRELLATHEPELVRRALQRVEATPARQIRRSRTALFRYLLTKLVPTPHGHA